MIELLILGGIVAALAGRSRSSGSSSGSSSSGVTSSTPRNSDEFYEFDYRNVGGEWRAYIVSQPSYRGRSSDAHSTHRLRDSQGQYVCWSEPIETEDEARQVARQWARCTDEYIATGRGF